MKELNEQDLQLILQHMEQNLPHEQESYFQQKYESDPEFKKEADEYRNAFDAIRLAGKARVKNLLQQEATKYIAPPAEAIKKVYFLPVWVGRAAAAAVLIGLSFFAYQSMRSVDSKALFAQSFKPMKNYLAEASRSPDDTVTIDRAFQNRHTRAAVKTAIQAVNAYIGENYAQSVALLSQISEKDDTLALYQASAYLKLDQPKLAAALLLPLQSSQSELVRSSAAWYQTLVFLQENDIPAVRTSLRNILSQPQKSSYFDDAQTLSGQLQRE